MRQGEQLAAIDLGSNSFHMVVARQDQAEVRLLEGLSEKVQLGSGLGPDNRLDEDTQQRALECLARFAQRITDVPRRNVRVVGTNTLRMARNARAFIARAEEILGHDIEVVAGREEARLIYLGVAHSLASNGGRRLVVDIGGGSTELIVGEGFEPVETESLHMGCVSFRQRFFADGRITEEGMAKAITAARQEVLSIEANYRRLGWEQAVGASGSIKAIAQVCEDNGYTDQGISVEALEKITRKMIKAGCAEALPFKGLREDRKPIFAPGLAILLGIFKQLGIAHMTVSSGALREGLLYDLLGRFSHEDVRERSVQAVMDRYRVDGAQASRVHDTVLVLHEAVARDWGLDNEEWVDTLRWAALLHEVGLTVSHSQFHKHGAYMVSNADLPGFSRQEQAAVALLIRAHRRKLPLTALAEWDEDERPYLLRLGLLLRLACRLHHARSSEPLPPLTLSAADQVLTLTFPEDWLTEHPLTRADLEQEQEFFQSGDYRLVVT